MSQNERNGKDQKSKTAATYYQLSHHHCPLLLNKHWVKFNVSFFLLGESVLDPAIIQTILTHRDASWSASTIAALDSLEFW